ncbi:uncharacterized protein LOC108678495 isoform X2 [Hyalella azteca]|uniref:Uncharacterized protein LOC108678495 isoform X2 n=1 Tax=Hyalella azteca TaxID=294128 RepID=A0A979FVK5_HYAAZ|nr:uncharacterized protein LOC108678495 isoform X2 [Hyalella azteca]
MEWVRDQELLEGQRLEDAFVRGELPHLNNQIAPLTLCAVNLPLLVSKEEVAKKFHVRKDCITLKRKLGMKSSSAIIVPLCWYESDIILTDHCATYPQPKKEIVVRQCYDSDTARPSSEHYKPHVLSSEEFDLSPARSGLPTLHVINDDVLLHIMKYLNFAEKLMLEAVCRRFQSLVYSELGQNSIIDFFNDTCAWRSACSNLSKDRNKSPAQLTQDLKLCTYKMLIMNSNHLTTLRLNEDTCIFDVNVFAAIGRLAVNLEDLRLVFSESREHYTSMKTIFSLCSKLKTFSLTGRFSPDELLRDLKECKCLEVLRLCGLKKFNINGLLMIQAPLREIGIHNVASIGSWFSGWSSGANRNFPDFQFNSRLTTFRMFYDDPPRLRGISQWARLFSMARKCPALTQLQLRFWCLSGPPNFKSFKNLKVLHFIASRHENIDDLLKSALPDLEDFHIEFLEECVGAEEKVLSVDFSLAPPSVKSLTLSVVRDGLDDGSYKSIIRMPNLQRVFVNSEKFSVAQLKLLVAHVQLVEISAPEVTVDLATAQELAELRRKALAESRFSFPSQCLDHDEPLVLQVNYTHHATFADPLVIIKSLCLHA